jgi:hypothetical protein
MTVKFHKKNPFLWLALIAGLNVMLADRACADHVSGTLFQTSGYVLDNLGNPIEGVGVTGDNYVGDFYPSTTDSNGYYLVNFPIDGNYRITVDCTALMARGYGCIAPVSMTQEADPVRLDFTVEAAIASLLVTNISLPKGNVTAAYSAQLGASGGNPPYNWQMASNSPSLPTGLSLNSSGLISGTPTTNNTIAFKVQVTDANSAVTNKVLFITINRQPVLLTPIWRTNRFSMRLFAAADQNYTIQMTTNLSSTNWTSLFVTNNLNSSSYIVIDPNATNKGRFYRVVIGP